MVGMSEIVSRVYNNTKEESKMAIGGYGELGASQQKVPCVETRGNTESSTIASAVSRLMANQKVLGISLKELESKINPILRQLPNPDKGGPDRAMRVATCTLDELFRNMEQESDALICFVAQIKERIEL